MSTRTRYFVIASLLLLAVGLGTGLVAYSVGYQVNVFGRHNGPAELRYVPRDAAVLAYADVRDVMTSELRQKVHDAVPHNADGQRQFENETGINIETDIDRVVAFVEPGTGSSPSLSGLPGGGLVLARGRFDEVKIEALMRDHGAQIENYKGKRMIVADVHEAIRKEMERRAQPGDPDVQLPPADTRPEKADPFAVAFIESGLVAVGTASLVRNAIDLQNGGENVTSNDEVMNQVRTLESGNAWAIGRFDAIQKQAKLPPAVANQLPPITWFSITSHVNGGIHGVIRAETRDDESANNLRDVVRGFMALAKMQAGSRPEYQTALQALEIGGTGKTVALTFAVPADLLDLIGKTTKPAEKHPGH